MHLSEVAADRLLFVRISGGSQEGLIRQLGDLGYDVHQADSVDDALPKLTTEPMFPLVFIVACDKSARMREGVGDELVAGLDAFRRASADSQIVVGLDASVDLSICVQAINSGVAGFVELKNEKTDSTVLAARLAQAWARFERARKDSLRIHSGEIFDETGIAGCSRAMAKLLSQAGRAAEVSDATVLIYGESGTGKQLLAEMIHRLDAKRSKKPFLAVNCAAITGTLAESALFGHVKGAFTGAADPRAGYFRAADGGTVFLDEISELSAELQPKLLRFLQEGVVMPVGSDEEFDVDVRIIAAANQRIPVLVEEGSFRLDLFQRLNVITLDIPPLRERRDDIPILVDVFARKYATQYDKPIKGVHKRVYELLANSRLEGNVRELENCIRRAVALKQDGDELTLSDLPPSLLDLPGTKELAESALLTPEIVEQACEMITTGALTLPDFVDECERMVLAHAIADTRHNHSDLSRLLGLSTRTLYNKRRKYRL